jgi:hypothetical protein
LLLFNEMWLKSTGTISWHFNVDSAIIGILGFARIAMTAVGNMASLMLIIAQVIIQSSMQHRFDSDLFKHTDDIVTCCIGLQAVSGLLH